eukprot:6473741-Amphidinium_carterae.3
MFLQVDHSPSSWKTKRFENTGGLLTIHPAPVVTSSNGVKATLVKKDTLPLFSPSLSFDMILAFRGNTYRRLEALDKESITFSIVLQANDKRIARLRSPDVPLQSYVSSRKNTLPKDEGTAKESDTKPKSSSSSSASSSSSSSTSDDDSKRPTKKKKHANKDETKDDGARDRSNHTACGPHFYITRFKDNTPTGYHMSCRTPKHERCTKEMAAAVAGGSLEGCRRVLKAWLVLGATCPSRDEHMSPALKPILLQALKDGSLMTEPELDEILAGGPLRAPFTAVPEQPKGSSSQSQGLLGKPDTGVSASVHTRMEALAAQGSIPITSLEQRRRSGTIKTRSGIYEVPEPLREACEMGYLSPNFRPPVGLTWIAKDGVWRLAVRLQGG